MCLLAVGPPLRSSPALLLSLETGLRLLLVRSIYS